MSGDRLLIFMGAEFLPAEPRVGRDLHVAREMANHEFSVAGGVPGMKVSWQVTGVRHDAYASAHPMSVEATKPEKERGHYLHSGGIWHAPLATGADAGTAKTETAPAIVPAQLKTGWIGRDLTAERPARLQSGR